MLMEPKMSGVERKETMWCTDCGARFTDEEIKGWGCPKCGSQGVPCGTDQDVAVEVNWHELRILVIWAENYAASCQRNGADKGVEKMPMTVSAIARRLQRQHPNLPALTLAEEIAGLPAALDKAGIGHGTMETNIPRPTPVLVNGPGAVGHSRKAALHHDHKM
jgi:hypothetical protein